MPYNGDQWDETNPTNATLANEIDDNMRDMKIGVRGRMAQEHVWPSSQASTGVAGYHTIISFQGQTATPTLPIVSSVTQAGILFMTSGNLVLLNSAGAMTTLISSGATSLTIINGKYSSTGLAGELLIGSSGGNIAILPPASTSGLSLISSSGAAPAWGLVGNLFGTDISKSFATTYQATSDGIVCGYTALTSNNVNIIAKRDSNSNPSTIINQNYGVFFAGAPGVSVNVNFAVKKNDYYSVAQSGAPSGTLVFTPSGA